MARASRRPDLVAPGKSVIGLRVAGSYLDGKYPDGRVGDRYFKGSGTSQSTAVVAGAAALLLSAKPWLNNDQVKRLLMNSASPMPSADAEGRGAGRVNVAAAKQAATPYFGAQKFVKSVGLGSIAKSRGSALIKDSDGVVLLGDVDIFGAALQRRPERQLVVRRHVERQLLVRQLVVRQLLVGRHVAGQLLVR